MTSGRFCVVTLHQYIVVLISLVQVLVIEQNARSLKHNTKSFRQINFIHKHVEVVNNGKAEIIEHSTSSDHLIHFTCEV